MAALSCGSLAGSVIVLRLIGVATAPGPTPTTRMSCLAESARAPERLMAELAVLALEPRGRFGRRHVGDADVGALRGELQQDRLADPAVTAGNDGNLVLQRHAVLEVGLSPVSPAALRFASRGEGKRIVRCALGHALKTTHMGCYLSPVNELRRNRFRGRRVSIRFLRELADQVGNEPGPTGLV